MNFARLSQTAPATRYTTFIRKVRYMRRIIGFKEFFPRGVLKTYISGKNIRKIRITRMPLKAGERDG